MAWDHSRPSWVGTRIHPIIQSWTFQVWAFTKKLFCYKIGFDLAFFWKLWSPISKSSGRDFKPLATRVQPVFIPCATRVLLGKPRVCVENLVFSTQTLGIANPCATRVQPVFYPCEPVF